MQDWLKEFIKSLPLDDISEFIAESVVWWGEQVRDIPASELPFKVYAGGSLIACILWFFVARVLPRPLGSISWIILISVLFTPSISLQNSIDLAPASIAVIYALVMKDYHMAAVNALPIVIVMLGCFFLGFTWHCMRYILLKKQQDKAAKIKLQEEEEKEAQEKEVEIKELEEKAREKRHLEEKELKEKNDDETKTAEAVEEEENNTEAEEDTTDSDQETKVSKNKFKKFISERKAKIQ